MPPPDESDLSSSVPSHPASPVEAANHIVRSVAELAGIAREHRLDFLGYLLDMAYLEARQTATAPQDERRI